jgi:hypothetical protein
VTYTATEQGPRTGELPQQLFRHWVHSREEDRPDSQAFRPDDFDFPPSFGRDGFEMRPDGEFVQDDVGPADGIVRVRGHWSQRGPRRVEVRFDGEREDYAFTVVSIDEGLLRIRPESPSGTSERLPCATDEQLQRFAASPPASAFRLIDFSYADVVILESFPPQFVLRVSGTKPYANMTVQLVPLVYVQQPEYWEIEVVGSLSGIGLPAEQPYEVSLAITSFLGTAGVEVVGASRRQKIDVQRSGTES